jgi:choline dehydrogenase
MIPLLPLQKLSAPLLFSSAAVVLTLHFIFHRKCARRGYVLDLNSVGKKVGPSSASLREEFEYDVIVVGGGKLRLPLIPSYRPLLSPRNLGLCARRPSIRAPQLASLITRSRRQVHCLFISSSTPILISQPSGTALSDSSTPAGFSRLLWNPIHVHGLRTEPQTAAGGRSHFWPRGASPVFATKHSKLTSISQRRCWADVRSPF